MLKVVDVYNIEKFLNIFPFEGRFGGNYSRVNSDYKIQIQRDGHRRFSFEEALNAGLYSFTPKDTRSTEFKIVMTIK